MLDARVSCFLVKKCCWLRGQDLIRKHLPLLVPLLVDLCRVELDDPVSWEFMSLGFFNIFEWSQEARLCFV